MEQRLQWVDYAKGIGIILVVYGHVARGLVNAGLVSDPSFLVWLDGVIYGFHMPLFFLLAGLFFFESIEKRGALRYVEGKVSTLVYPYVLWSLLQGGIEVLLSAYTNSKTTWSEVLALLWAPRAQFWFLYALFFCSVCAALLWMSLRGGGPRRGRAVVLVGVGLLVLSLSSWMGGTAATRYVAGYFGFFALGALWSVAVRDGARTPRWLGLAVGSMVALQLARDAGLLADERWVVWLAAVAGSATVMWGAKWLQGRTPEAGRRLRLLQQLGEYSLPIYLMHVLAGSGVRIALQFGLGVQDLASHLMAGCLVGLLAPLWLAQWLRGRGMGWWFAAPSR